MFKPIPYTEPNISSSSERFKQLKHELAGTLDKITLKQYGVVCFKKFYGPYTDGVHDPPLTYKIPSTQDFSMCPASPLVISEGEKFI